MRTTHWIGLIAVSLMLGGDALAATPEHHYPPPNMTVAADGSGDYPTLQAAIDAVPAYPYQTYNIHLLPGTYKGVITIPRIKPHIHLYGDDAAKTIITFGLGAPMPGPDGKPMGTFATPTMRVLANDFTAENVTFVNSFGPHGQALAAEVAGDRDAFYKCRFLGWQDTLFADSYGRNYFLDCYIAGHVDFIFGKSTAVFDHCEIHSLGGGYLTAASTLAESKYGYVFLHCRLTADPSVRKASVYLGRPWRPYAATAFIDCWMGDQIRPAGWFNWNDPSREKTSRYAEYNSSGPGGDKSHRVPWAKQLTAQQADQYTAANILAGNDNWNPLAQLRLPIFGK
jgi:pectinesterase